MLIPVPTIIVKGIECSNWIDVTSYAHPWSFIAGFVTVQEHR